MLAPLAASSLDFMLFMLQHHLHGNMSGLLSAGLLPAYFSYMHSNDMQTQRDCILVRHCLLVATGNAPRPPIVMNKGLRSFTPGQAKILRFRLA